MTSLVWFSWEILGATLNGLDCSRRVPLRGRLSWGLSWRLALPVRGCSGWLLMTSSTTSRSWMSACYPARWIGEFLRSYVLHCKDNLLDWCAEVSGWSSEGGCTSTMLSTTYRNFAIKLYADFFLWCQCCQREAFGRAVVLADGHKDVRVLRH